MFIKTKKGIPIALHTIECFYKEDAGAGEFVIRTASGRIYSIEEETYDFLSKMILTDFALVTTFIDLYARLTKEVAPHIRDSMDKLKRALAEKPGEHN